MNYGRKGGARNVVGVGRVSQKWLGEEMVRQT